MNGGGFPLPSPHPLSDPFLPQPTLLKRLCSRFRISAHTASPPPRLLLVVLLAAQILVLAVIRLGPSTVPPAASARRSSSLFVGTASQIQLKFLPRENEDSPSLPVQKTRSSLPQDGKDASLRASESSDELPASASTRHNSYQGSENESRSETWTGGAVEFPVDDAKPLPEESVRTIIGAASLTREGKAPDETVARKAADDFFPSVDENTTLTTNGDTFPMTEGKSLADVGLKSRDDLLPSVENSFLTQELATNNEELPSADEKPIHDTYPSTDEKSSDKTARVSKGDDLLPIVEDSFLSDAHAVSNSETTIVEDRSAVVDVAAFGKDERSATVEEGTAEKLTFLKASPSVKEDESTIIEEVTAEESSFGQDGSPSAGDKSDSETVTDRVEEEKSTIVEDATAEESTFHDASPILEEKLDSENPISSDLEAGKLQNEPVVSTDGSNEQPVIAEKVNPTVSSECQFGYIYMYNLPAVFNHDIVSNCSGLNPWIDVCSTLANGGLGESLGDASPLGQTGSWFISDQFTAEIVFHNRMLQHPCLTDKPELASGFYVPFYAGLDIGRYLWQGSPVELRDRVSKQLLEWLNGQEFWKQSGGRNHFMMIGRITWDFRRSKDEDWGSGFFYNPPMLNTTRLLIERNPWDEHEMAVPYPTNFHPQSDADLRAWQDHLRSLKRSYLFSFAGAPRNNFPNDFRAILLSQCKQAKSCKSLDCSTHSCGNNQKSLELFMNSTFCLQPRGDSFTRRSTFDCLLSGSIPVFFWHRSAYWQYKWHLPSEDESSSSYSVFIPKEEMRNGTKIEQVLTSLSPEKVQAMQEAVIQMIPKIVYAASGFSLKEEKDAFDVAIEGVLRKFKQLSSSSISTQL